MNRKVYAMHEYRYLDATVMLYQLIDGRYQAELTFSDNSKRLTKARRTIRDVQRDVIWVINFRKSRISEKEAFQEWIKLQDGYVMPITPKRNGY